MFIFLTVVQLLYTRHFHSIVEEGVESIHRLYLHLQKEKHLSEEYETLVVIQHFFSRALDFKHKFWWWKRRIMKEKGIENTDNNSCYKKHEITVKPSNQKLLMTLYFALAGVYIFNFQFCLLMAYFVNFNSYFWRSFARQ